MGSSERTLRSDPNGRLDDMSTHRQIKDLSFEEVLVNLSVAAEQALAALRTEPASASAPSPAPPPKRGRSRLEFGQQLTKRETSILRLLPTRLSQREIAGELFVSVNTVKTHCRAIYRKLGVSGRQTAVEQARRLGLLPLATPRVTAVDAMAS